MPGDDPHFNRVAMGRQKLLDLLASFESDDVFWPDGRPEVEGDFLRMSSLLNADALGGALACSFLGHLRTVGPELAEEWLAELMQVFVRTVQREAVDADLDFDRLKAMADRAWDFAGLVPDELPDDVE